jgi:hypothetical protein
MNDPRASLSFDEREILDTRVLPTARRWLRQYPNLAEHAAKTLTYWGEPLIDDRGIRYNPMADRERRIVPKYAQAAE